MFFFRGMILFILLVTVSLYSGDSKRINKVTGQIQMVENEPFAHPALFVDGKALHIDADSTIVKALVKLQGERVALFYTKKVTRLKETHIKVVNYKHVIHK